jgi:hypothetical protein
MGVEQPRAEAKRQSLAARGLRLWPHRGPPPDPLRPANKPSLTHKFCYRALFG